ncbi:DNA repair protein SWI5 homolog [Eublepharis macularius]|uniref:DNA repair protein SWI5 homolog n=1 Tax=Eublepharis macularius TaxID=481883 RepID=A0AA97LF24_EUBMA|nr:DNA repair protein SWI5 homolog [Eublepharis macularius]XP_054853639.1 DNA repair protein SWI5 homolog [Eublepharis macularius]
MASPIVLRPLLFPTPNPNMQSEEEVVRGGGCAFNLPGALDNPEQASPSNGGLNQSPAARGRPSPRPPLRRTPTGTWRNCNAHFKSPVLLPRACQSDTADRETLQHEIEELKCKDLALDQEIAQLVAEGFSLEELDRHIALLHEYNEIKDTGQMLLGRLAVIRGVTTKELYPEFDLDLND